MGNSSGLRRSKRLRKSVNIRNRFLEGIADSNNNTFRRNSRRLAFVNDNLPQTNLESLPPYEDIGDCENICSICYAYFWFDERVLRDSTTSSFRRFVNVIELFRKYARL